MRFINLCTVDNSYEANFIKEELAQQGIQCIITNENFTNLMPFMNGMLGSGIQILVDKDEINDARQIIDKRSKSKVVCPNCESKNIRYGLGTTHRLKRIVALVIAVLVASPARHVRHTYYCADCRTEFGN